MSVWFATLCVVYTSTHHHCASVLWETKQESKRATTFHSRAYSAHWTYSSSQSVTCRLQASIVFRPSSNKFYFSFSKFTYFSLNENRMYFVLRRLHFRWISISIRLIRFECETKIEWQIKIENKQTNSRKRFRKFENQSNAKIELFIINGRKNEMKRKNHTIYINFD